MARLRQLRSALRVLGAAQRAAWQRNDLTPKRMAGRALQRARAELFEREPLCRECRKHNRTSAATIRDHIIPLFEGGTDDDSNIQPLCQTCSDAKTTREGLRGRGYAGGG